MTRLFAMMALAFGMVMAVSCSKDEENNSDNPGGGETPAANPLVGHTFSGSIEDDTYYDQYGAFYLDFEISATTENRMNYTCSISYDQGELGTDNDQLTYTFDNNAGTLTFDADGYATNYTYDPNAKTITFNISYGVGQGMSIGGTAVLHQVN